MDELAAKKTKEFTFLETLVITNLFVLVVLGITEAIETNNSVSTIKTGNRNKEQNIINFYALF